nr:hypothetical protein [Tanacetum cinerariifolium]
PVLGYLKFNAKGTKSEVFGIPIPDSLITTEIQQATYYQEYLARVTHHRKYLAGETGGVQNPPASKPTQPARKPKAPTRPSISIPVASTQPAPTSAPAKSQENKRKQAMETTDSPLNPKGLNIALLARHASPKVLQSLWVRQRFLLRNLRLQMKMLIIKRSARKGKDKVTEEQVAHDLLSLQKHKKISPSDNEEESEKVVLGAEKGGQDEGQAGPDPDAQAEDQTGSDAGQAGTDPGDAEAKVRSISSPVVHAGLDREHMNLDVADVSPQPSTKQLDEGFTATVYPNVQENLKLAVEEPVLLEEPGSSSRTLSSLQHLKTEVKSIVNVTIQQALSSISLMTSTIIDLTSRLESPKEHQQLKATTTETTTTTTTTLPPPQDPQQSTIEAMMVKRISPLRNYFRDLPESDMKEILHQRMWESDSYKSHEDHMQLFEDLEKSMNRDHSEELTQDLAEARKKRKKSRELPKTPPGSPSHQPPPPPPPAGPSGALGAPRASGSAQMLPSPPPPSSTNQESRSKGSTAPSPSKTATSAEYQAWMMTNIRLRPSISLTPADLEMDEDMAPYEQAQSSNDEDIGSTHISTVNLRQGWWKPFKEEQPTTPKPA